MTEPWLRASPAAKLAERHPFPAHILKGHEPRTVKKVQFLVYGSIRHLTLFIEDEMTVAAILGRFIARFASLRRFTRFIAGFIPLLRAYDGFCR
jgi:hypothetical protein